MTIESKYVLDNITMIHANPMRVRGWLDKLNLKGIDLYNFNGWLISYIKKYATEPMLQQGKNIYIYTEKHRITINKTSFIVISIIERQS